VIARVEKDQGLRRPWCQDIKALVVRIEVDIKDGRHFVEADKIGELINVSFQQRGAIWTLRQLLRQAMPDLGRGDEIIFERLHLAVRETSGGPIGGQFAKHLFEVRRELR